MSATLRVNGDGFFTTGTLVSVAQLKAVKLVVKDNSDTAVDLRTLDDGIDKMVSLVVKEFQPLMYLTVDDNTGTIYMVVDGHPIDAASMQLRLRHVVAGKLGVAEADNDSTVAIGTSFTVS